jgi:DNA-binding NarL/FixJ family response regulator
MSEKIRVTILDDHQPIVDGYRFRLAGNPNIEIAAAITYGEQLESTLQVNPTDVLILDVGVPTSKENANPYPILNAIPALIEKHPNLNILVISMFADRELIRAVMQAGANGYILKDDSAAVRELAAVVVSIFNDGMYLSQKASQALLSAMGVEEDGMPHLSARQREVLSLCAAYPNLKSAGLAEKMGVLNSTVRNLLSSSYERLGVQTRAGAIARARELGLITPINPPTQPILVKK